MRNSGKKGVKRIVADATCREMRVSIFELTAMLGLSASINADSPVNNKGTIDLFLS